MTLARLVLLNGAPGSGKTSLARRFVTENPLALLVDIDDLRTQLGQWETREESRAMARVLALALAEEQLSSGHDVVIPQYVGRIEFVEQLAGLASRCGAEFLEFMLVTEVNVAIARFRSRRRELEVAGTAHPEADVAETDIDDVVQEAFERLSEVCDRRPTTRRLQANGDVEETYSALLAVINAEAR